MPVEQSTEITTEYLRSKAHADLLESADEEGVEYVETFLADALETVQSFLDDHGKSVDDPPAVTFDQNVSGVDYDPYHRDGEMLIFGGPRGILQGGYQYLSHRDYLSAPSLLTILSKGLLHAYNQTLVMEYFRNVGGPRRIDGPRTVELYTQHRMLAPGVDEGITQMFALYIEGDITDGELREAYVDEWASWYEQRGDIDVDLFEAVAYTISDRIEQAGGDEREQVVHGLAIQEPLIAEGQLSVLHERLGSLDGGSPVEQ